ncbi:hypothetical protein PHMEG_00014305 [Phytophthora megakarya]|uniref:Uncharacterized protein n=1 Tax=Phytophthora megakarya TaxID=4795 RepID=A0A225W5N8_9STRA|nr:hypothetical protein PHMEG_00014305 [Phytophthora megakarya]
MDFVIPLPKSRQENLVLLFSQCAFTDVVVAKPMSVTTALRVAQVFEEDPRFMSEVFQALAEMMQSGSRATLS